VRPVTAFSWPALPTHVFLPGGAVPLGADGRCAGRQGFFVDFPGLALLESGGGAVATPRQPRRDFPMRTPLELLNASRIASPCPASWEMMAGEGRVRHCAGCGQHVYDLSA